MEVLLLNILDFHGSCDQKDSLLVVCISRIEEPLAKSWASEDVYYLLNFEIHYLENFKNFE